MLCIFKRLRKTNMQDAKSKVNLPRDKLYIRRLCLVIVALMSETRFHLSCFKRADAAQIAGIIIFKQISYNHTGCHISDFQRIRLPVLH